MPITSSDPAGHLVNIIDAAVSAVDAAALVQCACRIDALTKALWVGQHRLPLAGVRRICVIGAGKAARRMVIGLEESIAARAEEIGIEIFGQVNVPDDKNDSKIGGKIATARHVKVVGCRPPGHNFPTERVVRETKVVVELVRTLQPGDICLALISGGGSALLELPKVPLVDLVAVSKALSHSGADIESLNTVRRCLSQVKAGGLAQMKPAGSAIPLLGMIISDVISDDLAMISSGPTVIDSVQKSTDILSPSAAANAVLQRFLTPGQIPKSVTACLQSPTGPVANEPNDRAVKNILIGNNQTAIDRAARAARELGYVILSCDRQCLDPNTNVNQLGRQYAQFAEDHAQPDASWALIIGGEPTVTLCQSPGVGGRNLQLAAVVLERLLASGIDTAAIRYASVGTDGEDGTAPAAGGWFDGELLERVAAAATLQRKLRQSIANNDCYTFFDALGYSLGTLPDIQTNVCDLQVMLFGCPTGPTRGS